jgi:GT2 family glycosyltransferase
MEDEALLVNSTRLSIVLLTYARDKAVQGLLDHIRPMIEHRTDVEVVLVDNNEDVQDRSAMLAGFPRAKFHKTRKNQGATVGRNCGIEIACGKYLLFLDDDAVVYPANFVDVILQLFDRYPKAGILAFKSLDFDTKELIVEEFPHTNKHLPADQPFKTFRFIGAANAVRREVFEEIGLYRPDFFYAAEEFDLAYRAIKAGYEIWYAPEVWVLHKHDPAGRMPSMKTVEINYRNKLRVGFLHLPQPIRLINMVAWTGFVIWRSRGKAAWRKVLREFRVWALENRHERNPLGREARRYIRSCGGAIWR